MRSLIDNTVGEGLDGEFEVEWGGIEEGIDEVIEVKTVEEEDDNDNSNDKILMMIMMMMMMVMTRTTTR